MSMGAITRRKFRPPVVSRLTFAWVGAVGLVLAGAGAALYPALSGKDGARVSLPIDALETMARPVASIEEPPMPQSAGGLKLAAPGLREDPSLRNSAGDDIGDRLAFRDNFGPPPPDDEDGAAPSFTADDVVITIPGARKAATPVTAASLTPATRARPVSDPDPALLRATPFGKIPKVGPDGRKAMHVYRNNFEGAGPRPQVSLMVGGLGLNRALTEKAIDDLPPEISLAFAPYAKDLEFWTEKARKAGHEVVIELPMESYGSQPESLGAAGLLSSRTPAENLQRLDWLMSRFEGYFAATNYLGGKFSADPASIAPVLAQLREAGVAYIDDTGAAKGMASRTGAVIASVNTVIPPAPDNSARNSVRRELERLQQIAQRDGAALAKTYAYEVTIEEIAAWAGTLDEQGMALAPASAALPTRYAGRKGG